MEPHTTNHNLLIQHKAVSDSALRLDPLASSGIATALDAGHRAAEVVADALIGNNVNAQQYENWYTKLDQAFTYERAQHYEIELRRRKTDFWRRRFDSCQPKAS